ncbi:MAG: hypothetical protein ACC742_06925 [Thermoanaerobaculales bacterium]
MTRLRKTLTVLLAAAVVSGPLVARGGATDLDVLGRDLETATRAYDRGLAITVLACIRRLNEERMSPAGADLQARAALLAAEIERLAFEDAPPGQRAVRSEIGRRIDEAADQGLIVLDRMSESSERYRIEADLLATKIRSDFRAKKFRKRFQAAVARALELDEGNPRAWVTAAKPLAFAGPKRGGDLSEAVRLLDRALELAPGLESALLLRGLVWERRGDQARAEADWRAALDANPQCKPASVRLGL